MAILAECPVCHRKQKTRNKICLGCGNDMDKAKRSKAVKYWITYRLPGGKQRREPVGDSIEEARDANGKRRGQKRENRIFEILPEANQTFEQLADWYLGLEKTKRLAYYTGLKSNLKRFNEVFGDIKVCDLKVTDLESYQIRRTNDFAPKTIDDQISAAKTMVTKALNDDLIGGGDLLKPFRLTKNLLRKGDNRRKRHLEYLQIYGALPKHSKAIFAMGYYTGMRKGEILNLSWDKVDLKSRMIYLSAEDTKERRTKKVPIAKTLRSELMQLPGPHTGNVFTYGKKQMGDISQGIKVACQKVGIKYGRFIDGGFIFHDLRHSFITNCRRAGIDRNVQYAITGHSNSRDMNQRYDTISEADLLKAVDIYDLFLANVDQNVDQNQNHNFK